MGHEGFNVVVCADSSESLGSIDLEELVNQAPHFWIHRLFGPLDLSVSDLREDLELVDTRERNLASSHLEDDTSECP